jgi:hypothetical protein
MQIATGGSSLTIGVADERANTAARRRGGRFRRRRVASFTGPQVVQESERPSREPLRHRLRRQRAASRTHV